MASPPTNVDVLSSRLQRNKSERDRLQDLMKSTDDSLPMKFRTRNSFFPAWDHWMVNDGGQQLFLLVFIFLQAILFAFGFANYFLKDNLNNARSLFGDTYGEFYMHTLFHRQLLAIKFLRAQLR